MITVFVPPKNMPASSYPSDLYYAPSRWRMLLKFICNPLHHNDHKLSCLFSVRTALRHDDDYLPSLPQQAQLMCLPVVACGDSLIHLLPSSSTFLLCCSSPLSLLLPWNFMFRTGRDLVFWSSSRGGAPMTTRVILGLHPPCVRSLVNIPHARTHLHTHTV